MTSTGPEERRPSRRRSWRPFRRSSGRTSQRYTADPCKQGLLPTDPTTEAPRSSVSGAGVPDTTADDEENDVWMVGAIVDRRIK